MCSYEGMAAIGNYALIASAVVVVIAGIVLALVAMIARDRRGAALSAASMLAIPICIIPVAAVAAFMTTMAHQVSCPGLLFHSVSAVLGDLALTAAFGCPLAMYLRRAQ